MYACDNVTGTFVVRYINDILMENFLLFLWNVTYKILYRTMLNLYRIIRWRLLFRQIVLDVGKVRGVFPVTSNGKNATNFFPPNILWNISLYVMIWSEKMWKKWSYFKILILPVAGAVPRSRHSPGVQITISQNP